MTRLIALQILPKRCLSRVTGFAPEASATLLTRAHYLGAFPAEVTHGLAYTLQVLVLLPVYRNADKRKQFLRENAFLSVANSPTHLAQDVLPRVRLTALVLLLAGYSPQLTRYKIPTSLGPRAQPPQPGAGRDRA